MGFFQKLKRLNTNLEKNKFQVKTDKELADFKAKLQKERAKAIQKETIRQQVAKDKRLVKQRINPTKPQQFVTKTIKVGGKKKRVRIATGVAKPKKPFDPAFTDVLKGLPD